MVFSCCSTLEVLLLKLAAPATSLTDTVITVYSGTCGSLDGTEVDCSDDFTGLFSLVSLTGQTPGSTLLVGVWKYGTVAPSATSKDFKVSACDASLANGSFDNTNFAYYQTQLKTF